MTAAVIPLKNFVLFTSLFALKLNKVKSNNNNQKLFSQVFLLGCNKLLPLLRKKRNENASTSNPLALLNYQGRPFALAKISIHLLATVLPNPGINFVNIVVVVGDVVVVRGLGLHLPKQRINNNPMEQLRKKKKRRGPTGRTNK